jgi:hypothetical protein
MKKSEAKVGEKSASPWFFSCHCCSSLSLRRVYSHHNLSTIVKNNSPTSSTDSYSHWHSFSFSATTFFF